MGYSSIRDAAIQERKGPRSVVQIVFPGGRNVGVSIPSKYRADVRHLSFHAISSPEFSDQRSRVAPCQEPLLGWHGTHLEGIAFSREVGGRGNNGISAECPTADDRSCAQNGSSLCRLSSYRTKHSKRHPRSPDTLSRNRSQQSAQIRFAQRQECRSH